VTGVFQLGLWTEAIAWEYRAAPAEMTGGPTPCWKLRDESREDTRPCPARPLSFKSCAKPCTIRALFCACVKRRIFSSSAVAHREASTCGVPEWVDDCGLLWVGYPFVDYIAGR